ncbi:MAG: organoarsenical effux MFS transporter ArsJ [Kangiellaceae bacterium]|nr:organoarsenical effux MFS transporter ArsJ [Kangiellaceae bacterium]MCW9000209.1 organoarsenical effux MFS transporter ArsJ [Kangiellaceae bacterium]
MTSIKNYATVTAAYWGFTLTDGALRMLVVLYFHQLGYSAIEIAFLFLFYEFFGVVTNLVGGWLAARFGLNKTLFSGLALQVLALYLLSLESYLSVPYVMAVQALSGIAKDLNKMSAKSSLKLLVPDKAQGQLFKWVSILTGSKNTLKGVGFFLGGFLLTVAGYHQTLIILAAGLALVGILCFVLLPSDLQAKKSKAKFKHLFSKSQKINRLSAARFFLFGARDIWFVVALPVFLQASLSWGHAQVGTLMAAWVILYGFIQSSTPRMLGFKQPEHAPDGNTAALFASILFLAPLTMVVASFLGLPMTWVVIGGLLVFAVIFAMNSAIHSFLILAYSTQKDVSLDVGFYYMSNAAGRLIGTLLSGIIYQQFGFVACIAGSALMIGICSLISTQLEKY